MSLGMQVRTSAAVSPLSERGPAAYRVTTNINIQVNTETDREGLDRQNTTRQDTEHKTDCGDRARARGTGGRMPAGPPARMYGHAEVTVSANRLTDGSRRTFRGTGHSKIHDSPLCARTYRARGEMRARAAMLRSRTHRSVAPCHATLLCFADVHVAASFTMVFHTNPLADVK